VRTGLIFEITGLVSAMIIGMVSICQQSAAIKRYSFHRAYSAQIGWVTIEVAGTRLAHAHPDMGKMAGPTFQAGPLKKQMKTGKQSMIALTEQE
jgi:hypothetical protein